MGAAAWFIFMIFVMIGVVAYTEGANGKADDMSDYDSAHFKHQRVCMGLSVAAAIGVMTVPIFMWFFK